MFKIYIRAALDFITCTFLVLFFLPIVLASYAFLLFIDWVYDSTEVDSGFKERT